MSDDQRDVPSTPVDEDDEAPSREDVEPDPTVGERPPPSNGEDLEGDERPVEWRPGRRHGRSAETQRRDD